MSTPVIEKSDLELAPIDMTEFFPFEETSDASVRTHIVNPTMNQHIDEGDMTAQEIVDIARMTGAEITALCGYRWVPKHNPEKFDVCEKCVKIAEQLMAGAGE